MRKCLKPTVWFCRRFAKATSPFYPQIGWLYEQRDYSAATPAIGENRDDDRNRFQAELELPLGDRLFTVLEYEYGGFSSNLESADYDQHVAGLRVGLKI